MTEPNWELDLIRRQVDDVRERVDDVERKIWDREQRRFQKQANLLIAGIYASGAALAITIFIKGV